MDTVKEQWERLAEKYYNCYLCWYEKYRYDECHGGC